MSEFTDRIIRQAAGLLMSNPSTDSDDHPWVAQKYLRQVFNYHEKGRQAAITMRKAADRIREQDKRIEELEAHLDTAVGFGGDWERRAKNAESQLDKVYPYIRHKPDCEVDDDGQYVDHDHQYASRCTCGLQQALQEGE